MSDGFVYEKGIQIKTHKDFFSELPMVDKSEMLKRMGVGLSVMARYIPSLADLGPSLHTTGLLLSKAVPISTCKQLEPYQSLTLTSDSETEKVFFKAAV